MPPKRGLDKGVEKRHEKIEKWPLLAAVFKEEGVEKEFECERRYLPKSLLSKEELGTFSQGQSREIEQCYVQAEDAESSRHTFRLRRTVQKSEEGELLRIARKTKVPDSEGKTEVQLKFSPTDSRAEEFERLWKKHEWHAFHKTRYYIQHALPNGHTCEIHYDVHHGGELDEFVRIEVEFKNDADAAYAASYHGSQPVLPEWIGQDVTGDKRYSSKSLAKGGLSKETVERMKMFSLQVR